MKYIYTFAAGVLVIAQGLFTFVVPAEQLAWTRWRVGAIIVAVLAVLALAMQLRKQAQEDKQAKAGQERRERRREQRERERDKKIDELLRKMPPRGRTRDSAVELPLQQQEPLARRVERLVHEYYACLQEGAKSDIYKSRLKPQLLRILPELQKAPVKIIIPQSDIEPEEDDLAAAMRSTADTLALAVVKLEYPKTKLSGNYLVLDEQ